MWWVFNGAAVKIVEQEKLPESCLVGSPRFRRLKKVRVILHM